MTSTNDGDTHAQVAVHVGSYTMCFFVPVYYTVMYAKI